MPLGLTQRSASVTPSQCAQDPVEKTRNVISWVAEVPHTQGSAAARSLSCAKTLKSTCRGEFVLALILAREKAPVRLPRPSGLPVFAPAAATDISYFYQHWVSSECMVGGHDSHSGRCTLHILLHTRSTGMSSTPMYLQRRQSPFPPRTR